MSLNLGSLKMGGLDEELADSVGLYSVLDLKIDMSKLAEGHDTLAEASKQTDGGTATEGELTVNKTGSVPTITSKSTAPGTAASSSSTADLVTQMPTKPDVQDVSDEVTITGIEVEEPPAPSTPDLPVVATPSMISGLDDE